MRQNLPAFMAKSSSGLPPFGTWLMSGAPSTAEALGHQGFDFLVLDMEHVPIGIADAIGILRAIAGTPAEAIVRLAWNDQILVKQVLDAGGRHLMFPFIQTADEARAAVSYTRYPPGGVRGVAAVHRASRFGADKRYLHEANDRVGVILQIETPAAVDAMPEIAAVDGVDAIFVGPGDLAAAMGHLGDITHSDVRTMLRRAVATAHEAGKPVGIVGPNPAVVQSFIEDGFDYVAIGSDIAMMTGRATDFLSSLRGIEAAAAPNQPIASAY